MTIHKLSLLFALTTALLGSVPQAKAQTAAPKPAPIAATAPTPVPALIPYSGVALGENGKSLAGQPRSRC